MEVRLLKSDVYLDYVEHRIDEKEREKFVKQLKNDTVMEETFKGFLLCILTAKEKFAPSKRKEEEVDIHEHDNHCISEKFEPSKRKQEEVDIHENDDDWSSEEEDDPQYAMFLQNLEEHEKSYVLKHNVNGSHVLIKYEGESDSDDDSDLVTPRGTSDRSPDQCLDPRRKLRPRGPSNQKPDWENESGQGQQSPRKLGKAVRRSQRKSVNTAREENVEAIRISNDLTPMLNDDDYSVFLQSLKEDGDNTVFTHGSHEIVYEKDVTDIRSVKLENDDGNSGLKIPDTDPDSDDGNLRPTENVREESSPEVQFNFRKELLCILRRPYDRKEYDKLWQELTVCKPVSKHKELRDGRDVEYLTDKAGKSLLESYSDFQRAFSRFENDKPRRLNLMRGFFFWLEHLPLEGSFMPWMDTLCLAVEPKLQAPPSGKGKSKQVK